MMGNCTVYSDNGTKEIFRGIVLNYQSKKLLRVVVENIFNTEIEKFIRTKEVLSIRVNILGETKEYNGIIRKKKYWDNLIYMEILDKQIQSRREDIRIDIDGIVNIYAFNNGVGKEISVRLIDISTIGLSFECDEDSINLNDTIIYTLQSNINRAHLTGIILWKRVEDGSKTQYGVKFIHMTDDELHTLKTHIIDKTNKG